MAQFPKVELTQQGKDIIIAGQNGEKITFTKAALGDGLSNGADIGAMTSLVHAVTELPLQDFKALGDGRARLRFVMDNNQLEKGFFHREIGIYAKVGDGAEKLYAYTNAGNLADYVPGKESPIASKIIDLYFVIGNAANLTIIAENSAYITKLDFEKHNKDEKAHAAMLELHNKDEKAHPDIRKLAETGLKSHREKPELDHPDGSVTAKKLAKDAVTTEKIAPQAVPTAALKDKAVTRDKIADGALDADYMRQSSAIVSGNVDWNTLTDEWCYKIHDCVMSDACHAPAGEYKFGLLVVQRLKWGEDEEYRTLQIYYPHKGSAFYTRMNNSTSTVNRGFTPWVKYNSTEFDRPVTFLQNNTIVFGRTTDHGILRIGGLLNPKNEQECTVTANNHDLYIEPADDGVLILNHNKGRSVAIFNGSGKPVVTIKNNGDIQTEGRFIGSADNALRLGDYTIKDMRIRGEGTGYTVGDIAYDRGIPSWARLECVKAGVTGNGRLTGGDQIPAGKLIQDGSVVWIVDDIRDGMRVGDIILRPTLRKGYIKANGATVQRVDYPRLVAYIEENGLWTGNPGIYQGLYGKGDGSTTMVMPDFRGNFVRALDEGRGIDPERALGSGQKGSLVISDDNVDIVSLSFDGSINIHNVFGYDPMNPEEYSKRHHTRSEVHQGNDLYVNSPAYWGVTRPRNIALIAQIKY